MKKLFALILIVATLHAHSQSVFGYWYGNANVKTKNSANNYLVELVLQPEKGYVKGILNYYFRNTYRSLQVKGNYNAATRRLSLYDIPVIYHGSFSNLEVDCVMNMQGILRVAKKESTLAGSFVGLPDYKYTCADINFILKLNAGISKKDSVLKAIREYKEAYQVWKPSAQDTLTAINIGQRKLVNYVIENEFKERENIITGDLEGTGVWTFEESNGITHVQYTWDVVSTKKIVNLLSPVLKWFFNYNHNLVMHWGAKKLAKKLHAQLLKG